MNRDKNAPQGSFTIALNLLITGTPDDMEVLVGKQHEGGTSSRMALGVLPTPGRDLPNFPMLEGNTLEYMQDQIDEWTEKFSYHTDENGDDVPAQTHTIDLDYVADALRKWILEQYDLGVEENNQVRMDLRTRIASTVFNCAIVWHMLFDEPDPEDDDKRMSIVKLCIYMANYLMERWLHKYGQKHNAIRWKNMLDEMVKTKSSLTSVKSSEAEPEGKQPPKDNTERDKTFFELYTQGKGYGMIAKMFGVTKSTVSSAVHRYGEKLNGNSGA